MRWIRMTTRRWMIAIALTALVTTGVISLAGVAREAGRRGQCMNNLRQISLALVVYQGAHGSFPLGTVGDRTLPPERRLSWTVVLIDYLSQGLQLIIDLMQAYDSPANLRPLFLHTSTDGNPPPYTTSAMDCWVLQCPSHAVPASASEPAPAGYVGISGLGTDAAALPPGQPRAGVFGYDRATRIEEIKDGASETLLLAETTSASGPWTAGGQATVRGVDPSLRPVIGPGRQFGGIHRNGAMVAFSDGSVRLIRESIDPRVFEAISTVAGGEQLPPGWDR